MALTGAQRTTVETAPWGWALGDRLTVQLALFLVCWALAAVLLAVIGWFHWGLVATISLAGFLVTRRFVPEADRDMDVWWWLAIVLGVSTLAINGLSPGEHLLTGRDSGTYMATAGWLAEESTLLVDARTGPLADVEGLQFVLPGFYEWVDGNDGLEPQFMHAFPAMLGTLIDARGIHASYWLNPALGAVFLLALFSLGRRFMRPWAALVAIIAVASSLVFLYFARTPFSEVLMATFVVSGLGVLGEAEERSDTKLAMLAGAILGATVVARIDGIVLMIPLTLYLLIRARTQGDSRGLYTRTRYVMFLVALVGLAESLFISPAYILDRSRQVALPLSIVLVLVIGDDLLGDRLARIWKEHILPHRTSLFIGVAAVAGFMLTYAWLVRPHVLAGALQGGDLAFIEMREGLETEPISYPALSVRWVTWYQGVTFVALGWVGAALMVKRAMDGELQAPSWLVPLSLATFSILYFWRPSIAPDHIWAMRRFLTVVIPLGALTAAVAIDWLHDWTLSWVSGREWIPMTLTSILTALLVAPALSATAPVWSVHEFEGLTDDMIDMCDDLEDDTSVLVVDYSLAQHLVQGFRSYCGVPAAWTDPVPKAEIDEIRTAVESMGGSLAVVTLDGQSQSYLDGAYLRLELTLSNAPSGTEPFPVRISVDS